MDSNPALALVPLKATLSCTMVWEVRSKVVRKIEKLSAPTDWKIPIPIKEIDGRGSRIRYQIQAVGLIES